MSDETREQAIHDVVCVLPNRADDLARLETLLENGEAIVTVIGKYNHGETRLLNELIGRDTFAVADRRETVRLSDSVDEGVRWLDAPGLDADVQGRLSASIQLQCGLRTVLWQDTEISGGILQEQLKIRRECHRVFQGVTSEVRFGIRVGDRVVDFLADKSDR